MGLERVNLMFRPLIPVLAICSSPYLLLGSQPLLPCLSKWPPKGLLDGSESAKTERTECFSSTSARSTRLKCSLLTRVRCALSSGCLFAHKQLKRQLAFPRQCQGLTVYCWLRGSASSFWTLTLFSLSCHFEPSDGELKVLLIVVYLRNPEVPLTLTDASDHHLCLLGFDHL